MGLIEWLTGWRYVGTNFKLKTYVHPKIIKSLEKKANKVMQRKDRGRKSDISGCVVYTRGKTFVYKGKEPSQIWIDNHGHGGRIGGAMKIFRKLKKKKNKGKSYYQIGLENVPSEVLRGWKKSSKSKKEFKKWVESSGYKFVHEG